MWCCWTTAIGNDEAYGDIEVTYFALGGVYINTTGLNNASEMHILKGANHILIGNMVSTRNVKVLPDCIYYNKYRILRNSNNVGSNNVALKVTYVKFVNKNGTLITLKLNKL